MCLILVAILLEDKRSLYDTKRSLIRTNKLTGLADDLRVWSCSFLGELTSLS